MAWIPSLAQELPHAMGTAKKKKKKKKNQNSKDALQHTEWEGIQPLDKELPYAMGKKKKKKKRKIKTTMSYYITLACVRIAIIKKSTNNKFCQACREKGILLHCWWKCKLVKPLRKTAWKILKNLKVELSYDLLLYTSGKQQKH